MLIPVIVRASYKVTATDVVTLETIIGSNLPLLFPEVWVSNRTPSACTVTVSGETRNLFVGSPDPDFDGAILYAPFIDFSLSEGQTTKLTGFSNSFTPTSSGITNEISLTRASGAAEARISLLIKGLVESSVSPDPLVTINV